MRIFIEFEDENHPYGKYHELVKVRDRYCLKWIENFRLDRKRMDQKNEAYRLWDLETAKIKDPITYLKVQFVRLQESLIIGPNWISQKVFDQILNDTKSVIDTNFGGQQCLIPFQMMKTK